MAPMARRIFVLGMGKKVRIPVSGQCPLQGGLAIRSVFAPKILKNSLEIVIWQTPVDCRIEYGYGILMVAFGRGRFYFDACNFEASRNFVEDVTSDPNTLKATRIERTDDRTRV
jgi:hypothetical protein